MKLILSPMRTLAAAVATLRLVPTVQAQLVFDTLGASNDGAHLVLPGTDEFSRPIYVAQSFTTDATSASIAALGVRLSSGSLNGSYTFSLWSNGANAPATQIGILGSGNYADIFGGAFGGPGPFPPTPTYFNILFSSLSIPVTPNTRYWVYATTTGTDPIRWGTHESNLVPGEMVSEQNNPPTTARTQLMSVTVAPIPEPATEAACAAGALLAFGVFRWIRSRSR